jgi:hypothetical protein
VSARPKAYKQDPEAMEVFKKIFPPAWRRSFAFFAFALQDCPSSSHQLSEYLSRQGFQCRSCNGKINEFMLDLREVLLRADAWPQEKSNTPVSA